MRAFKSLILVVFGTLIIANTASAATITFGLNDFLLSTVTTSGVNLGAAPALPLDGTFTLPVAGTIPLAGNEGKFLRFNFALPSGFTNLAFNFEALVDDEFAVYLNDVVLAIQGSTGTDNFSAPLPGFAMNAAGTVTDTSGKLEFLLTSGMQSVFQVGANELTLFGTDTLINGGIGSATGTITFDTLRAVPEPSTLLLLGSGLIGLGGLAWRKSRSRRK